MAKRGRKIRTSYDSPLARKRMERGMSQQELANKVGCNAKSILRWESDQGTPSVYLLRMAAKVLDCTMEELLE